MAIEVTIQAISLNLIEWISMNDTIHLLSFRIGIIFLNFQRKKDGFSTSFRKLEVNVNTNFLTNTDRNLFVIGGP